MRDLALWLRPAGWPGLPDSVRGRVRVLAWFAVFSQAFFVVGWILAGMLEPAYSPMHMYISELGRHGAAHPWIFDLSDVVWGAGFVALGLAMWPGLRTRPWGWAPPTLFVLAGVFAMLAAPLRLDCAASVNHVCHVSQAAGTLSWRHYGHLWAAFAIAAALVLTPFALARAEWPSRLGRLTLLGGIEGLILWGLSFLLHTDHGNYVGLWQRAGLLVIHGWVLTCAAAVILEARPGWPPVTESAPTWDGAHAVMPRG